jgi:predicted metal-dependent phosphotriesterase family hydrolase
MAFVRTILGDIDAKDMGITNAHEHLIRTGGAEVQFDGEDMRLPSAEKAVAEARMFVAAGGKTIVDANPCCLGRDIAKLLEVNAQVGIHIVATTGFHEGKLYDNVVHWVNRYTVEQIAELLIADIEEGIDIHDYMGPIVRRSEAKAGAIKIASGYGLITPFERKFIHAAALAQKATGAPVNTHTRGGTMALEQAQLLISHGVKPERIILGHVQRNPDLWYHKKIAHMGCSFMYDGGYRIKYLPDSSRVELIRGMIQAGYQKHIVLGCDAGKKSYQKSYGSGTGMDYDLTVFVPRLREEGISEDAIEDILVNNPARLFSFDKAEAGKTARCQNAAVAAALQAV